MMKMKLLSVCLCIGILLTALPAFAALSVEDLQQIRKIVREENAALAAQMQAQMDGLQTQIDMLFKLQLALMAFIAVVVGIPQIIGAIQQYKKQREHEEKIEALQAELNELKQRWLVGT